MRIQVLNPANSFKPVSHDAVKSFIGSQAMRNGLVLRISPEEDSPFNVVHVDDQGPLLLDDRAGVYSMGVSAYSNHGLTHFGINELRRAG